MIKRNVCEVEGCERFVFKNKKCNVHCDFKSAKKVRKSTMEFKKKLAEKRAVYFDYHISLCKFSEESLTPISSPTRSNICHILPKSTHESLGEDLRNFVYLTQEEHDRFDKLLFKHDFETLEAEFPRAWKIVLERLKPLLEDCKESTFLSRALNEIVWK